MSHWVRIETDAEGKDTAHNFLDLSLVSRVHVRKTNKQLKEVNVVYGNQVSKQPEVLPMEGVDAESFLKQWYAYIGDNLKHQDPEAEPGNIHIPGTAELSIV